MNRLLKTLLLISCMAFVIFFTGIMCISGKTSPNYAKRIQITEDSWYIFDQKGQACFYEVTTQRGVAIVEIDISVCERHGQ